MAFSIELFAQLRVAMAILDHYLMRFLKHAAPVAADGVGLAESHGMRMDIEVLSFFVCIDFINRRFIEMVRDS